MKLFLASTMLAAAVPGIGASDSFTVEVNCKGVDQDSLSSKALSYSAKALEATYNSVHKDASGNSLAGVVSAMPFVKSDDSLVFSAMASLSATANAMGDDLNCGRRCRDDDFLEESTANWEKEFQAMITQGPFEAFQNAKKCHIKMITEEDKLEAMGDDLNCGRRCRDDDEENELSTSVSVDVQCDNVDFTEVPMSAVFYATSALQTTFDSLHTATDGNTLNKVAFTGLTASTAASSSNVNNVISTGVYLRAGADSMGDDLNCGRRCRDDDELESNSVSFVGTVVASANDAELKKSSMEGELGSAVHDKEVLAWENLFLAKLLMEPHGSFKLANHCRILMSEGEKVAIE